MNKIWTTRDFDAMNWHDTTLWGLGFQLDRFELLLDVDYIVEWVGGVDTNVPFQFWVAPATLVFENVFQLAFDVEFQSDTLIEGIHRTDQGTPRNADYVGTDIDWLWTVAFRSGSITFRSTGFTQSLRKSPVRGARQSLTLEERQGINFTRGTSPSSG